ncbi:hypothetical protein BH20ACT5_BH20ACT5_21360 [soil metagenome]
MVRMQVTLASDEHRLVRARAKALGLSVAEYIRRVIAADLAGGKPEPTDVAGLTALGDSGGSDIASRKREYVETALRGRNRQTAAR